jgi:Endonuclease/Exonuclease/phosphatase family
LRDRKIDQLATVIAANEWQQRTGFAWRDEVENGFVVDRLVDAVNARLPAARTYSVIHADTDDDRGIDVAFLHDNTLFKVPSPLNDWVFVHVVMRGHATREIVQVNFKTTTAAVRGVIA